MPAKPVEDISSLELRRLETIKRNEEYLRSLGIGELKTTIAAEAEQAKAARASKRKRDAKVESDDWYHDAETYGPQRGSRRIQQLVPEHSPKEFITLPRPTEHFSLPEIDVKLDYNEIAAEDEERETISAPKLQQYIEECNADHLELIEPDIITHTAYRMSYMSGAKLATRVKAITRAAGKQSVGKLLAFYYALKLAKLDTLAETTKDVLTKTLRVTGFK